MLIKEKENQIINSVERLPLILALNSYGEPVRWINYEKCAYYKAKDKILWSLGTHEFVLRGGTSAKTGEQSKLVLDTIVAINYAKSHSRNRNGIYTPRLTNRTLFARDRNICAYCGQFYKKEKLTCDHIIPQSKGGKDIWENVVTSCYSCNQYKGNKSLQEVGIELLYVPYTPSLNEHLILQNRKILADQMDFLMKGVSGESRLRIN